MAAADLVTNQNQICVECGNKPCVLIREFPGGILKIEQCPMCKKIADKYVEYDSVVIFLDALLQKPQAYRHLFFNTNIQWHWKFFLLLLACDSLVTWDLWRQQNDVVLVQGNYFLTAVLSVKFYVIIATVLNDWLVLLLVCFTMSKLFFNKTKSPTIATLCQSLVLSSYGKVFAIPILLWDVSQNPLCLTFCQMFVFISTVIAYRVLHHSRTWSATCVMALVYALQALIRAPMNL